MATKTNKQTIVHWQSEFIVVVRVPVHESRHTVELLSEKGFDYEKRNIEIDRSSEFRITTDMKRAGELYNLIMQA